VQDISERLARAATRTGLARSPRDGVEASTLLSAARSAATSASPGACSHVSARTLELGTARATFADESMLRLLAVVERLGRADLSVLVLGETGSGKEIVARALHAVSPRAGGPFIAVNCAALVETLAESELFGHERGAFTGAVASQTGVFEAARGGTLFLDEIGELEASLQPKLLRALEARCIVRVGSTKEIIVDVRVVAATHADLAARVEAGSFRADLFHRIRGAALTLPPLRMRPRELAIAQRFLDEACTRLGDASISISHDAMQALSAHPFPGNVRELKNPMELVAAL
jgi:transcriptional regulator with GAF, ATPase, and Fis domain